MVENQGGGASLAPMRPIPVPVSPAQLATAFSLIEPGDWRSLAWAKALQSRIALHVRGANRLTTASLTGRVLALHTLFAEHAERLQALGHLHLETSRTAVSKQLLAVAAKAPLTPTGFDSEAFLTALSSSTSPASTSL